MALVGSKAPHRLASSDRYSRYVTELSGLLTLGAALFVLLSFGSYHLGSGGTWGGFLGATLARGLAGLFGYAVYVLPVALVVLALHFFRGGLDEFPLSRFGAWGVVLLLLSAMLGLIDPLGTKGAAGWVGGFFATLLLNGCGQVGAWLILSIGTLTILSYIAGTTPLRLLYRVWPTHLLTTFSTLVGGTRNARPLRELILPSRREERHLIIPAPTPDEERPRPSNGSSQPRLQLVEKNKYQPPPLSLLERPRPAEHPIFDEETLRKNAKILEEKLAHFAIDAEVVAVGTGPVITTFEIQLGVGIKVNRVLSLQDDLSMALCSPVRILAPVPGKSVVGIEVANEQREPVYLSEILGSPAFQKASSDLTLALGKNSVGVPRVEDLARMPHLLIAGATGTGKSVFLNALVMSILSKASPRQVRFVMIDLKMLELCLYEGLPHQIVPVVTNPNAAIRVLNNLCREMDQRYQLLRDKGVRNIDAYNALLAEEECKSVIDLEKVAEEQTPPEHPPLSFDQSPDELAEGKLQHEHMPKIVVIIDELADLMVTSSRRVEEPIIRLAQKGRACGIHLIVATQRPSVDVVTGLIKANFPARVSFQVPTRTDSRTILDCSGAERLLGEGDMLFSFPGKALERIHGAFVGEREIHRFTEFVKQQCAPQYALSLLEDSENEDHDSVPGPGGNSEEDELYDEAVRIVAESRIASISYLQRRLRIGFNRAARLIERMETDGVVSKSENGRPREVLVPPPPEP